MAGRGPAPKPERSRGRDTPERQKLVSTGKPAGHPLPKNALPIDKQTGKPEDWHPMTVRWWNHWRRSPQANLMLTEVDWDYLLDTALMHHAMWKRGRWEFANEIRMRVQKFGATPEDRLRLRVDIAPGAPAGGAQGGTSSGNKATVTYMDDRRRRLTDTNAAED